MAFLNQGWLLAVHLPEHLMLFYADPISLVSSWKRQEMLSTITVVIAFKIDVITAV